MMGPPYEWPTSTYGGGTSIFVRSACSSVTICLIERGSAPGSDAPMPARSYATVRVDPAISDGTAPQVSMVDPSPLSNTTAGTPGLAVPASRTFNLWPSTSTDVFGGPVCADGRTTLTPHIPHTATAARRTDLMSSLRFSRAVEPINAPLQANGCPLIKDPHEGAND